tara:strand:- start:2961 stop:3254 length:294 start_codon:yes stop_codon:yes gene_type:complete
MGKLLSTKNRALPAVDGYVLKGNTDGSQFWAAGGVATINAVLVVTERDDDSFTNISLSNYSFNVTDRSGSDVSISSMQVTKRDSYEAPLQTFITSVS